MGCFPNKSGDRRHGGNPEHRVIDKTSTITLGEYATCQQRAKGADYQIVTPDPDLGWRQLPSAVAFPPGTVAPALQTMREEMPLYPAPGAWACVFFNDRSGHFCTVLLITLSINIAIRAEKLAKGFGIITEMELSHSSSQELRQTAVGREYRRESTTEQKIYTTLHVPDYDWRLVTRCADGPASSSSPTQAGAGGGRESASEKSSSKRAVRIAYQLMKRGDRGEIIRADVPSIGMNIAEQLFRLERRSDTRNCLPVDLFGWRITDPVMLDGTRVAVISPDNEALWVTPEELIMNVTQWVQQTYLTSTAF